MEQIRKIEVAVYMPDEEAKQFLLFKEHYEIVKVLLDKGIFDIRNGSVSLHFDGNGVLQTIQRADILYSKRFEG